MMQRTRLRSPVEAVLFVFLWLFFQLLDKSLIKFGLYLLSGTISFSLLVIKLNSYTVGGGIQFSLLCVGSVVVY